MSERTKIIFLHVPKTGGTTLESYFKDIFPLEDRWCESDPESVPPGLPFGYRYGLIKGLEDVAKFVGYGRLVNSFRKLIPEVGYYSGHILYGFHLGLSGPYRYVTVLRNPVKRVVSYLNTLYSIKEETVSYQSWLDTCVQSKRFFETDNYQTRSLCGYGFTLHECEARVFDEAVEALRRDFSFGLTERMEDTIRLIASELQLPLKPEARVLNVSEEGSEVKGHTQRHVKMPLTEDNYADIEARNKWDFKLLEAATEIFEQRLRSLG